MRPSCNTLVIVPVKLKLEANTLPITIPTKRELYTSFVIRASDIATTDGTSAQNVACSDGDGILSTYIDAIPSPAIINIITQIAMRFFLLLFICDPP